MTPPDPAPPGPLALVVNDDEASRYVTVKILKQAGYVVREAETGQEALALAGERPDVIVLDVKLPDIDGFEVSRRLKADPLTASIPVLQTSAAYVTAEKRAEGLDSGADGYLVQPFEAIELVATIAALLRARRAGLGLGLTMVKKLVELHGGTVTADSAGEGQGATFTIRLPGAVSAIARPRETPVARAAAQPRRVLLVEDNADISDLIQIQLSMWGHEVSIAADGPTGLAAALGQRPDIAFVDVGLPGMDGYEVARQIRGAEGGDRIRLIAMTGYGRPEDRDRALAAGFDAHLVKPVDPRQLRDVLDSQVLTRG